MCRLYSIGELIIDFQSVGRGGLKTTESFIKNAGGAPANVCVQVSKLNHQATYLSQVGNDGFGDFLIESLKDNKVDTSFIKKSSKYDTSLAFVSYFEDGEREFSFYRKMAADLYFEIDDFKEVNFKECDILSFGSVALKTKESRDVHDYLIKKAKDANALIAFDPNLRFNLWEDLFELKDIVNQYLKVADIVKVGVEELEFITGEEEQLAIDKIFRNNIKVLLVTYGSKGAWLYINQEESLYNPGYKVNAIDTTGAGDSFFGGFISQILEYGLNQSKYEEMLDLACKCGAYTTTRFGAIKAMGTKEEILKEIK